MGDPRFNPVRQIHHIGADTRERIVYIRQHPALRRFGPELCGVSDARLGFHFESDGWANGQVLICFGGRGKVRVGRTWCDCRRGQAYLTPAGLPHGYRAPAGTRWRVAWVMYGTAASRRLFSGHTAASLVGADPMPLTWAIRGLYAQTLGRADDSLMQSWMQTVVMESARIAGQPASGDQLWQLWAEVDDDPAHRWSLEELADRAAMSSEHLRRLCRQQFGRSPMRQVTHLRIGRAARLLVSTRLKIEQIAGQVGYADRFAFSVAFAREMGRSPAEFRRDSVSRL